MQQQLRDIASRLTYTLLSGSTVQYSGLPLRKPVLFDWDLTSQDMTGDIRVSIAFEMLEPLMRGGISLTLAEMRLEYFRVAVTLLHETAVCSSLHY